MVSCQKYETRPLDCFRKGKELGARFFKEAWQAKEKGKKLGMGVGPLSSAFIGAFDNCEFVDLGHMSSITSTNQDLTIQMIEASRSRGYLSDICHANQLVWGGMFIDRGLFGGFAKPDFFLQTNMCPSQTKGAQVLEDYLGVPYFCIDMPMSFPEAMSETRKNAHIAYLVGQLSDAIEWMEKLLGTEFDDEKFIKGITNEFRSRNLFGKICELQKTVPAPLDSRLLQSMSGAVRLKSSDDEAVAFCRMLLDETLDRVKNGIARLATERCRLIHEGVPPYFNMRFLKTVERYGAIFVGGSMDFSMGHERLADGTWHLARTLEERGITPRTRDEALRLFAEARFASPSICAFLVSPKVEDTLRMVDAWHIDAAVFHCDHGCEPYPAGMPEVVTALKGKNIPTLVYEASSIDSREFFETQITSNLESFMEMLGLVALE